MLKSMVPNSNVYSIGGNVLAEDNRIYIPRSADDALLAHCLKRSFAYVLTSRQVGKSSLMTSTHERLEKEGVRSAIVDFQAIGQDATAAQLYYGFIDFIHAGLELNVDLAQWWQARSRLSLSRRFVLFFRDVVLTEITSPVVIFIDEVDLSLVYDFRDDFYGAIRSMYEARPAMPDFKRLSFVLMGNTSPGELIKDPSRNPLIIAKRVDLTDFTFEEALPLADGFGLRDDEARQVLEWALKWTGGHPYLTQKLCFAIAQKVRDNPNYKWTQSAVDVLVADTFLSETGKKNITCNSSTGCCWKAWLTASAF